jgi:CheY-like chemotaxis protein
MELTHHVPRRAVLKKLMIVNGNSSVLEFLESMLAPGHYDVVFVESSDHAYSQIKRIHPNLVVLCARIEDLDGFRVLSMLKLDEDTAGIPVLTYTTEYEGQELDYDLPEPAEDEDIFTTARRALPMN